MLHLTSEPDDQYDFSNFSGYQFVNQGILCLLALLYIIISSVQWILWWIICYKLYICFIWIWSQSYTVIEYMLKYNFCSFKMAPYHYIFNKLKKIRTWRSRKLIKFWPFFTFWNYNVQATNSRKLTINVYRLCRYTKFH
jgi:hypothetical protein